MLLKPPEAFAAVWL